MIIRVPTQSLCVNQTLENPVEMLFYGCSLLYLPQLRCAGGGLYLLFSSLWPASVVQLVRTSSTMRVVMSSTPDWSENFLIFHITYDSCYVIIEVWLSGSEPTIIRRSALVQQLSVRKDPSPNFAA